ncbi:extracellular solute-binding protein [Zooshikella ganghwensis]|uniref:ABC transporter substrate-binding protein n=1 Tax=Zooshikella ganghwensis TaxID=202772 RepID=A0A4P9VQX2_9GAMM|nr:extracellular solute-binding protein [Zooshikella ganghwensis]RDH44492.1 ABC transporter substrate-binding protein [Zooshikella ganghwensis]
MLTCQIKRKPHPINILFLLATLLGFSFGLHAEEKIYKSHAITIHGEPKYPADFTHFDFVNPEAPKGGTLHLATISSSGFDSLNPFIVKGIAASGLTPLNNNYFYDTLLYHSKDEPFTMYGLLAEQMEWPENRAWIIFHLHKNIHFHDGHPLTAEDVVFSFNLLQKEGHPLYKTYYANVEHVEALDKWRVKFTFTPGDNRELAMIIGQFAVLPKHYWSQHTFNKTSLTPPIGSGPYTISQVDAGRSITYQRDPNYWGKDLPVNRGKYNFNTIRYDYYRDPTVAIEALKAGEYDFRSENSAKNWATQYQGKLFTNQAMIKKTLPNLSRAGLQGFIYNIRRPVFADTKVRQALSYAYDFEWANKNLFYNSYQRTDSFFENSEMAASGLPSPAELKILEPFKKELPEAMFTQAFELPKTDGSGNNRQQLRQALRLLKEAGYALKEGKLINQQTNQPFSFEILLAQPEMERIVLPFQENLKKLGIEMTIRQVDAQQYIKRLRSFDFDMFVGSFGQSQSPGNEQRDFWHSSQADITGSRNYIGIKNPVIDQLVDKIITAPSREALINYCRALDRVLLWNHYVIPQFHINQYRLAYWNKFGQPEVTPKYSFTLDTWWEDPKKAEKIKSFRKKAN